MEDQFDRYIDLVNFMGEALGANIEVVLHDLRDCENSIVSIENNHISGRVIGGPVTDLALKIMKDAEYQDVAYLCNYEGKSKYGKALKSSTYIIRNQEHEIIGLLCINIDYSDHYSIKKMIEKLLPEDGVEELVDAAQIVTENLNDSVEHLIYESLLEAGIDDGVEVSRLSQGEKIEIIRQMNAKGIFLLKGAVTEVARQLEVSEATIYRYISIIRREERGSKELLKFKPAMN